MWYRVRHNTIDSILQSIDEISRIPIPKFWPFTSCNRVNLLFKAAQRLIEFDQKFTLNVTALATVYVVQGTGMLHSGEICNLLIKQLIGK